MSALLALLRGGAGVPAAPPAPAPGLGVKGVSPLKILGTKMAPKPDPNAPVPAPYTSGLHGTRG